MVEVKLHASCGSCASCVCCVCYVFVVSCASVGMKSLESTCGGVTPCQRGHDIVSILVQEDTYFSAAFVTLCLWFFDHVLFCMACTLSSTCLTALAGDVSGV